MDVPQGSRLPADEPGISLGERRTWLQSSFDPQSSHLNVGFALVLDGHLDVLRLMDAFGHLTALHPALRTTYAQDRNGHPWRVLQPAEDAEVGVDPVLRTA